ncbi:MAG TPA: nitrous oxide reductase accessory protein NosL [Chryseolinea sp.]|nr:nitrous oxide reductase accessory protein NosL [Chryseolinea sp.]
MRVNIIFFISILLCSCSVEPTPLVYGKDSCHACKMTLMDKKFGAEIVTTKGKVFKFDDVNCMISLLNTEKIDDHEIAFYLVIDFANPEKFVNAKDAQYVKSDKVRSPMASEVAAFSKKEDSAAANKEWKGILLSWGELVTEFK